MTDRTQFTVVFEGDISKLPFNPMAKHNTPFGRVIGCGYGNAFDEVEALIDASPIQRSAAPGDGLARERSARAVPLFFSSPDPLMTQTPEELDRASPTEVKAAVERAERYAAALKRNPFDTRACLETDDLRTVLQALSQATEENERLRLLILGGEDAPGVAASLSFEEIERLHKDAVSRTQGYIDGLTQAEAERDEALNRLAPFGDIGELLDAETSGFEDPDKLAVAIASTGDEELTPAVEMARLTFGDFRRAALSNQKGEA